ncbi:MAG: DUF4870 domain-containing protein [Naasia sp.]
MSDSSLPPADGRTPPSQPYSSQPTPSAPLSDSDSRLWASLAHFGGIVGPLPALLIFLILKDRSARVRDESKEALNFQITVTIGYVVLAILNAVMSAVFWPLGILIGFLQFALWAVNAVFSILGGLKVNSGGSYRYPFAVRLIS